MPLDWRIFVGDKRPYKPRKPGAGRKPLKPNYDAAAILQEHKYDRQLFDKPLFVFKNLNYIWYSSKK